MTLRVLPLRRVHVKDYTPGPHLIGPDGRTLALAGSNYGEITLVDLRAFRTLARFKVERASPVGPPLHLMSWRRAHRLLAYSEPELPHADAAARLLVIDPVKQKVLSRLDLGGPVIAVRHGLGHQSILLIAALHHVGPAHLVLVSPTGKVSTIPLPFTNAGFGPGGFWGNEDINPALAARGRTAYVVGEDADVARVDLRTRRVTYHHVPGLLARGDADQPEEPGSGGVMWNTSREAAYADGALLVAGYDNRPSDGCECENVGITRRGQLIDTRTWTVRRQLPPMFDPRRVGGLFYFVRIRNAVQSAFVAMTPSGRVAFVRHKRLLEWWWNRGRLFEGVAGDAAPVELNPRTGTVLRHYHCGQACPEHFVLWPER